MNHISQMRIRGSALVMACMLIIALSLMVAGTISALGTAIISNDHAAMDSELTLAATGFAGAVIKSMDATFTPSSAMRAYDMSGNNQSYSVVAAWANNPQRTILLRYRLANGASAGEKIVTARATSGADGTLHNVEVSVTLKLSGPVPDGYFGSNLAIGAGLTINTPLSVRGNVTGSIANASDLAVNEEVEVSGSFTALNPVPENVTTGASVPTVNFDIAQMVSDFTNNPANGVAVSNFNASTSFDGGNGTKGVKLRFDPARPNSVFVATSNAAINAVNQPYGAETELAITQGANGAVLVFNGYTNVSVEGTYSTPITVVANSGAVTISGSLNANPATNPPPIGLVAASNSEESGGNVFVRYKKNSNDFGFAPGSSGSINASIFSNKAFTNFGSPNSGDKLTSLTLSGRIIAKGGGTDLASIASHRTINGPASDATPPGMSNDRITATYSQPKIKIGTWAINLSAP